MKKKPFNIVCLFPFGFLRSAPDELWRQRDLRKQHSKPSKKFLKICFSLLFFTLISCDGTLGGFNIISFPVSKKKIEIAIDSLYSINPEYKIPSKWEKHNNWSKRGYDFLESRIFYFKEEPEEMYYISFIGDEEIFKDTTHIDIAIRSVFAGRKMDWLKQEDFSKEEESRIQTRFKEEIILKLEKYTNSKAKDLSD